MIESAAYISIDNRRRTTHFDESIENTHSFLTSPYAINVMGARVAQRYTDMLYRLRLPNFIHDTVGMTHFNDEDIPFIPVLEGDEFNISDESLSPNQTQRRIAEAQFGKNIVERKWSLDNKSEGLTVSYQHFQEVGGDIYSPARQVAFRRGISRNYWVMTGRPTLVENTNVHISRFAPIMIHELTHVDQHETAPILRYEDRQKVSITMELVAYRKQRLATEVLCVMGRSDELDTIPYARSYDDYAKKVDAVTQRLIGDQTEFELTDAMVEQVMEFDPVITGKTIDS
jgi:hypothetical protein